MTTPAALRSLPVRRPPSTAARSTALRPPAVAVRALEAFHRRLGLRGGPLAEKEAFLRESRDTFFRGTPALFHADVRGPYAREVRLFSRPSPRGLVNGDLHLGNLGTFRGPGGAAWGVNDFDQAGHGPVEWDLARLATSAVLAGRARGLSGAEQKRLVARLMRAYSKEVAAGARGPLTLTEGTAEGEVRKLLEKVNGRSARKRLERFADLSGPTPRLRRDDELRDVASATRAQLMTALGRYGAALPPRVEVKLPLEVLDVVRKRQSGGSSRGLDRFYALVAPARSGGLPVLIEVKELLPSPFVDLQGDLSKADAGAAVVAQRALGGSLNPLTAPVRLGNRSFLAREVEAEKDRLRLEELSRRELEQVVEQAAVLVARAHAQAVGPRDLQAWIGDDAAAGASRLSAFATRYANQTEADHAAYLGLATPRPARSSGREG